MDGRRGNGRPTWKWTADVEMDGRGGNGRPRRKWTAEVEMDGRCRTSRPKWTQSSWFAWRRKVFQKSPLWKVQRLPIRVHVFRLQEWAESTSKSPPFTGPKSKVQVQVLLTPSQDLWLFIKCWRVPWTRGRVYHGLWTVDCGPVIGGPLRVDSIVLFCGHGHFSG